MKTTTPRFNPNTSQEQTIISSTIDWIRSKGISDEETWLKQTLKDCSLKNETFSVTFKQLYKFVYTKLVFNTFKQPQTFTIPALHHFLCRTLQTNPVYKREPANKSRRAYFDLCVNTIPITFPSFVGDEQQWKDPVLDLVENRKTVINAQFQDLVNDPDNFNLVFEFLRKHKQEFVQFCQEQKAAS